MKRTVHIALAAALASATAALADVPGISELAPDSTVLVLGVKNAGTAMERFQRTGLWDLWKSQELTDMRADAMEDIEQGLDEALESLGLERDTLQPPTGELGIVVFTTMNEELGMPGPGFLLVADYGENADRTAELIDAAIAQAEDEEGLEYDEQDILGRTVRVFEFAPGEDEIAEDDEMGQGMDEFGMGGDPMQALTATMEKIYFAREGSAFLLCSDRDALSGAFETFDGEDRPCLAKRDDYSAVMENLGDHDAAAVLLFRDIGPLVAAMDPMGMSMMFAPMIKQFIGDIKGMGTGMRLDGEKAMVEETWFVHMPNGKTGLTALTDTQTPRGPVPAFVGANAVNYGVTNFEFQGLPALIDAVLQMLPIPLPPGPEDGPSMQEMIAHAFSCFGKEVHMVEMLDRPITLDSVQQCYAIECVKEQEFENFISGLGPGFPLEGRDFLGNRIYDIDMSSLGMMAPMPGGPGMGGMEMPTMAMGIAGGRLYAGSTASVEQALRTVGQSGEGGLAGEPSFQRAVALLSDGEAVGWGYGNLVDALEAQVTISDLQMKQFVEQLKAEDPEWAAELEEMGMLGTEGPLAVLNSMDWDLVREHVGPTAWETIATEDGFLGRIYFLSAEADE